MGFIRVKRIKGKEYAYLVENKWYSRGFKSKGRGSRQAVSKYLGKVFSFERTHNVELIVFVKAESFEQYLAEHTQDEVLQDLILWELSRHSVDRSLFEVDFRGKKIRRKGKEVSLKMNEGFLNSYTLRRIFSLKEEDSLYLAKCFIDAGIQIPQEVFVGLFVE